MDQNKEAQLEMASMGIHNYEILRKHMVCQSLQRFFWI